MTTRVVSTHSNDTSAELTYVANSELPHASKNLSEASDANSHANNGVRSSDTTGTDIVEGEDEGGRGEGEETP